MFLVCRQDWISVAATISYSAVSQRFELRPRGLSTGPCIEAGLALRVRQFYGWEPIGKKKASTQTSICFSSHFVSRYILRMDAEFEWDPTKAKSNYQRHAVSFY
jgi:hypothetical protein